MCQISKKKQKKIEKRNRHEKKDENIPDLKDRE